MPAWLMSFLLQLVLKFGIPAALALLKKWFPKFPFPEAMLPVLQDYVAEKKGAKVRAHRRLKECFGVACPMETVDDTDFDPA